MCTLHNTKVGYQITFFSFAKQIFFANFYVFFNYKSAVARHQLAYFVKTENISEKPISTHCQGYNGDGV